MEKTSNGIKGRIVKNIEWKKRQMGQNVEWKTQKIKNIDIVKWEKMSNGEHTQKIENVDIDILFYY